MGLLQVQIDLDYVYVVTTSGIFIYDNYTGDYVDSVPGNYFSSACLNDYSVFVGTTFSGVKQFSKSFIGSGLAEENLSDYLYHPELLDDNVGYLNSCSNAIMVCTGSGVCIKHTDTDFVYRATTVSGTPTKCFAAENHSYYYVVSGTLDHSLYKIEHAILETESTLLFTTGSGFLIDASEIYDIFVTAGTSASGSANTIFMATNNGAYVYDEGSSESYNYVGAPDRINSVWADVTTSITRGRFYIGVQEPVPAFSTIDLATKVICDSYQATNLDGTEIIDITGA